MSLAFHCSDSRTNHSRPIKMHTPLDANLVLERRFISRYLSLLDSYFLFALLRL